VTGELQILDCVADANAWDAALTRFANVDPCQYAAYLAAYAIEHQGCQGRLALYREGKDYFALPVLVTLVTIVRPDGAVERVDATDLETPHGYGGPLTTRRCTDFVGRAWAAVDAWTRKIKAIAELSRFSTATQAQLIPHPDCTVLENRSVAIVEGVTDGDELFAAIHQTSRTRARKAMRAGYIADCADRRADLPAFRAIYTAAMARNGAVDSFYYGDRYYEALERLPEDAYKLIGVWSAEGALVGGVLALRRGAHAAYHLAATEAEASRLGAGNLLMNAFNAHMLADGARRIVLGGGRTTDPNDLLLRFKRKNATGVAPYFIGLRVLDKSVYQDVRKAYRGAHGVDAPGRLLFYR
jgi:CelD/BcsL family acetyltransferase involved in cellulose biosynthesis